MKFLQKSRPRKAFQFSCCVQLRQKLPLCGTGSGYLGRILISPILRGLFHHKTKSGLGAESLRAPRVGVVGGGGTNWSWLSCEDLPGVEKFPSRSESARTPCDALSGRDGLWRGGRGAQAPGGIRASLARTWEAAARQVRIGYEGKFRHWKGDRRWHRLPGWIDHARNSSKLTWMWHSGTWAGGCRVNAGLSWGLMVLEGFSNLNDSVIPRAGGWKK